MVRRYPRFWLELLRLSWRRVPRQTGLLLGIEAGRLVTVIGLSLALRAVVDATIDDALGGAVAAAIGAAVICTLHSLLDGVGGFLGVQVVDQVVHNDLDPRIARDIAAIEGTDHLENSDVQDRLTVLRHSSWGLVQGMWSAVGGFVTLVQLALSLWLLGAIAPWLMGVLVVSFVPLWCDARARRRVNGAEIDTAEAHRLQRHLFELATSADGGKEIRVSGAGPELARRQAARWDEAVLGRFRARVAAAGWRVAGWFVFALGFVGSVAVVVAQASRGEATPGDLVLAITLAGTMQQTVGQAVSQSAETLSAGRLIEPYLWLRDYVAADRARNSGVLAPPERLHRGIELVDVSYAYPGTRALALDSVSVRIPAGSVVAIVGEYGSGKTTLVKLLNKFHRPDAGAVRVDDVDLGLMDTARWRARTSAAYQDFGRYPQTTVAESVGLGDLAHMDDHDRIAEAVHVADAKALVARLPDGMNTPLSPVFGGTELSEGQWQRIALARAAMRRDPLLFVLDEPTASLDAPTEHAVFERYMAHARGLARRSGTVTVVVSHRFSTVVGADLILVLENGRLAESGGHEELLAAGGLYSRLYGIQATAYAAGPEEETEEEAEEAAR